MRPLFVPIASMEQHSADAGLASECSTAVQSGDQAAAVQLSSPKRRSYAALLMRCTRHQKRVTQTPGIWLAYLDSCRMTSAHATVEGSNSNGK